MSFIFNEQNNKKIEELTKRYPKKKAMILPILWLAQKQEGYVSNEAIKEISKIVEMPYMHIYSVATFYTMYRLEKSDKPIIEVCRTLSCELNGSEEIKKYLDNKYSDKYKIIEVECMGACSGAPMCTLEGKYIENLTTTKIDEVLNGN